MSSEKDRFDEIAGTWDEEPRRLALASSVAEAIGTAVPLSPALEVLDFGCGTGLVTLALRPRVGRITGADTSSGMLEQLRRKIAAGTLGNVEAVWMDPASPRLPDGPFDLVVSSMALHHVEDPGEVGLAEPQRPAHVRLGPAGTRHHALEHRLDVGAHERGVFHLGFDRADVARWLEAAGFVDVAVRLATVDRKNGREYPIFLATGRKAQA